MSRSPFDRMLRRTIARFGIETAYIRGGEETPVKGIFDDDYANVDLEGQAPATSRTVQVGYHRDDLPYEPRKGDKIRVRGELYRVVEPQPDSEFGISIILKKAGDESEAGSFGDLVDGIRRRHSGD